MTTFVTHTLIFFTCEKIIEFRKKNLQIVNFSPNALKLKLVIAQGAMQMKFKYQNSTTIQKKT